MAQALGETVASVDLTQKRINLTHTADDDESVRLARHSTCRAVRKAFQQHSASAHLLSDGVGLSDLNARSKLRRHAWMRNERLSSEEQLLFRRLRSEVSSTSQYTSSAQSQSSSEGTSAQGPSKSKTSSFAIWTASALLLCRHADTTCIYEEKKCRLCK